SRSAPLFQYPARIPVQRQGHAGVTDTGGMHRHGHLTAAVVHPVRADVLGHLLTGHLLRVEDRGLGRVRCWTWLALGAHAMLNLPRRGRRSALTLQSIGKTVTVMPSAPNWSPVPTFAERHRARACMPWASR